MNNCLEIGGKVFNEDQILELINKFLNNPQEVEDEIRNVIQSVVQDINKSEPDKFLRIVQGPEVEEIKRILKSGVQSEEDVEIINGIIDESRYKTLIFNDDEVNKLIKRFKLNGEGAKNLIADRLFKIISDPKNLQFAYSPIEMDQPADAKKSAEEKKGGVGRRVMMKNNPMSVVEMKVANMVGKDVIGIAATVLKSFSGLTTLYDTQFEKIKMLKDEGKEQEWKSMLKMLIIPYGNLYGGVDDKALAGTFMGNFFMMIANTQLDKADNEMLMEIARLSWDHFHGPNGPSPDENQLKYFANDIRNYYRLDEDAALVMSALLSAATDFSHKLKEKLVF